MYIVLVYITQKLKHVQITNHKRPKIQSLIKPFEVALDLKADAVTKRRFIETHCALTALFRRYSKFYVAIFHTRSANRNWFVNYLA